MTGEQGGAPKQGRSAAPRTHTTATALLDRLERIMNEGGLTDASTGDIRGLATPFAEAARAEGIDIGSDVRPIANIIDPELAEPPEAKRQDIDEAITSLNTLRDLIDKGAAPRTDHAKVEASRRRGVPSLSKGPAPTEDLAQLQLAQMARGSNGR